MVCKPKLIFDYFTLSNIWYSNKSNIKADSSEKNFSLRSKKREHNERKTENFSGTSCARDRNEWL